jgi:DNA transposition AAA+ family ATPase
MSSGTRFIETKEYHRFQEFCDSCQQYRYIGLCFGPPGVGKTLSARHYSRWDVIEHYLPYSEEPSSPLREILGSHVVFYTAKVANAPGQIEREIGRLRHVLRELLMEDLGERQEAAMRDAICRQEKERTEFLLRRDWTQEHFRDFPKSEPSVQQVARTYAKKRQETKDPTTLIIIDEADRLKMAGLEQIRDIFDRGGIGLVLIGMPGLEKRLARYPQLYSRVGFVHEFRSLAEKEVRGLLSQGWRPPGVALPSDGMCDEESLAAILRITDGNFRLLNRLLTQIARVLKINNLPRVTPAVVEVARESLVIGTA